jgi:4-amino-4-deoxy-L-arabinose transferase-like glycosyltransferase
MRGVIRRAWNGTLISGAESRRVSGLAMKRQCSLEIPCLLLSLGIAALFLFYKFDTLVPPLPWSDETMIMADAVETLRVGPKLIYPSQLTGGSLAVFLTALHILLFGKGITVLRIFHAVINLALVAITYLVARTLFSDGSAWRGRIIGMVTCALLAGSTWFLSLGRLAFLNVTLTPLLAMGYVYLLWRGLRSGRPRYFLGSGIVMGISAYGYAAAVLAPLALPAFFAAEWLVSRVERRPSLILRHWRNLLFLVGATFVCVLPLVYLFVLDPEVFLRRPLYVGAMSVGNPWEQALQNGKGILASFGLSLTLLISNDRTRLVFDPIVSGLFWMGIVAAVWRWRKPEYLFLLVWWVIALLPFLFSVQNSIWVFDLMRRGVNAQPVSFIFPALAVLTGAQWLWRRGRLWWRLITGLGAAGIITFSGAQSFTFYEAWIKGPEGQWLFSAHGVDLAKWLTDHSTPDMVYLLPVRPHTSPTTRPELFSVRTYYEGRSAIAYPELDETALRAVLTQLATGRSLVKVLLPEHSELDPKGVMRFLLEPHATLVGEESIYGFRVKTYRLRSSEENFSADAGTPVNLRLGAHLQLVSYSIGQSEFRAGDSLWTKITWAVAEPTQEDYGTQLALTDAHGYVIVRTDQMLLDDNFFQATSHWQPGELSSVYYHLPIPHETPPGVYQLGVVAYDAEGERLAPARGAQGDLTLPLAEIEVVPSPLLKAAQHPNAEHAIDVPVTSSLHLVGVEVSATLARPGDKLRVTLTWQARSTLDEDFDLSLGLIRRGNVYAVTPPRPLVSRAYPTSVWRPGETLRVNYPFLLPAELETDEYVLGLRLLSLPEQRVVSELALQTLRVEARTHHFTVPPMERQAEVLFGDRVRLLGYDRAVVSTANREILVRLYWQPLAAIEESYTVFLHLVNDSNVIIAQTDTIPGGGNAPTTGWIAGEVIADELRVALPTNLSDGSYRLVLGMYESRSGTRLPVQGPSVTGDSFDLEQVEIVD